MSIVITPGSLAPFLGWQSSQLVNYLRSIKCTTQEIADGFGVSRMTIYRHCHNPKTRGAAEAKFWARVGVRGPDQCWNWKSATTPAGYARTQLGRKNMEAWGFPAPFVYAYRVAYRLHHGSIDHDLTIDHLCHNPRCCNPAHLRQCTKSENAKQKWFHRVAERPAHLKPVDQCNRRFHSRLHEKALSPEREQGDSPLPDTDKHAPSDEGSSLPISA